MNFNLNPGPLNTDVLFLHNEHRALGVFNDPDSYNDSLNVKRGDRNLWLHLRKHPVGDRVKGIIDDAGFGGVFSCGYRYIDHALITALVERWRPETHTFHLPMGEATVTLQDINVLWGLPIEGFVVSGVDGDTTITEAKGIFESLFGFTPLDKEFSGKTILSSSILREIKKPFNENQATPDECLRRARLFIFYIIGCIILPDNANNKISINYLYFLIDLNNCAQYSWGSACLASLYRHLCQASQPSSRAITGPVYILQIWAWERIRCMAPQPDHDFDYSLPLAARWQDKLNFKEAPAHCLRSFRSQLQSLHEGHFNWTPYNNCLQRLPAICVNGFQSWRCCCPLICWEIVEHHYPQRVMRQFDFSQHIPEPIPLTRAEHRRLHRLNRIGKGGMNWLQKHEGYVDAWNRRSFNVINCPQNNTQSVVPGYMNWYMEHTVVYVSDPRLAPVPSAGFQDDGARVNLMRETMAEIYRSSQFQPSNDYQAAERLQFIQDAAYRTMLLSNEEDHLLFPTHFTTDPVNRSMPPRPQRLRRRRQLNNQGNVDLTGPSNNQGNVDLGGPSNNQPDVGVGTSTPAVYNMHGVGTSAPFHDNIEGYVPTFMDNEGGSGEAVLDRVMRSSVEFTRLLDNTLPLITPTNTHTFLSDNPSTFQYFAPNQQPNAHLAQYENISPMPRLNLSLNLNDDAEDENDSD